MTVYLGSIKLGDSINKQNNKLVEILNNTIEELTALDFGDITIIPQHMLYETTSLKRVELPDSIEEIQDYAFSNCSSLSEINFPSSLKKIRYGSFNFTNLINVVLPDDLIELERAFDSCLDLETINIPDKIIKFGGFQYCEKLKSKIVVPETVTSFPTSYAFLNCSSLTDVEIKANITTLGYGSFSGCSSLKDVLLPNSLNIIDELAFQSCSSLETITIPSNVSSIGRGCFNNCVSLKAIEMLPQIPPTITSSSLNNYIETIYVPIGTSDAYKTANVWSNYADKIVERS